MAKDQSTNVPLASRTITTKESACGLTSWTLVTNSVRGKSKLTNERGTNLKGEAVSKVSDTLTGASRLLLLPLSLSLVSHINSCPARKCARSAREKRNIMWARWKTKHTWRRKKCESYTCCALIPVAVVPVDWEAGEMCTLTQTTLAVRCNHLKVEWKTNDNFWKVVLTPRPTCCTFTRTWMWWNAKQQAPEISGEKKLVHIYFLFTDIFVFTFFPLPLLFLL